MTFKCFSGLIILLFLAPTARADTDTVFARDFSFVPSSLTIEAGDTVVWKSILQCCIEHTSTRSVSPKTWNSGPIPLGGTFKVVFQFADSGTFNYFCQPHQGLGMVGSITALPIKTVTVTAGALNWLGLVLLLASLTAAAIYILESRRKTA
jgi:plastocyanin